MHREATITKFQIIPNDRFLKFTGPVILNSFQDLTIWKRRDAEPSLP